VFGAHNWLQEKFKTQEKTLAEPIDEDFGDYPEPRVGSATDPESPQDSEADTRGQGASTWQNPVNALDFSKLPAIFDENEEGISHSGKNAQSEEDISGIFGGRRSSGYGSSYGSSSGRNSWFGGNSRSWNNGWGPVKSFKTPMLDEIYPGRQKRTEEANREDKRLLEEARERNLRGLKADREESMQIYRQKVDGLKAQNEEDCARAYRNLDADREMHMRQGALSVDKYKMDWAMHNPGSKLPGSGFFSRNARSIRSRGSSGGRRSFLGRRELLFGRRSKTDSSGRRSGDRWNTETGFINLKDRGYGNGQDRSYGNGRDGDYGNGRDGQATRPLNAYGMEMPTQEEMEQRKQQLLMRYGCKEGWNPEEGPYQGGPQMGGPHMAGMPAGHEGRYQGGMDGQGRRGGLFGSRSGSNQGGYGGRYGRSNGGGSSGRMMGFFSENESEDAENS